MSIHYPASLKSGSMIAITAFSSGIEKAHLPRFEIVLERLRQQGFETTIGNCLMQNSQNASESAELRAEELQRFFLDDSIDAIAAPWGGEFAMQLLPLLDFERIAQAKPKWIFGFSDVSTLSSVLTAKLGWASAHCSNLMDLVASPNQPLIDQTLDYLSLENGACFTQTSSDSFTKTWPDIANDPHATVEGEFKTQWRWLQQPDSCGQLKGRLIGGCVDTLHCLFATDYLDLSALKQRHNEAVILFIENAEMTPQTLLRVLMSMRFRGVFDVIDGLIFGRHYPADAAAEKADKSISFVDAIAQGVGNSQLPIMVDVDIGHAPPNLTLINGAQAEFGINVDKGYVTQQLV